MKKSSPRPTVTLEWVFVTPEIAAEYLKKLCPDKQRAPQEALISKYEGLQNANLWTETLDPIMFGKTGALLNAQNRLLAQVRSGKSYWYLVARDCPISMMLATDMGRPRSMSDVGEIVWGDGKWTKVSVAVAKAIMQLLHGRTSALNIHEVRDVLRAHWKGIEWAMTVSSSSTTFAPYLAVIALGYGIDAEKTGSLASRIRDEVTTSKTDNALHILRLLRERKSGSAVERMEFMRKASRALLAEMRGEQLVKLQDSSEGAGFIRRHYNGGGRA